jgi:pimeloyl-ACP methyl ester carboxylesterase
VDQKEFESLRKHVGTPFGEIAYVEKGIGPVALFVHGVLLNGYLWRDAIDALSNVRRCIALDIMGHGATKAKAGTDTSFAGQAKMIDAFVDAMGIAPVDIVANDTGGGISQIFAAEHPEKVRSLTLTNCDAHDNYPPAALQPLVNVAQAGGLGAVGAQWLGDKNTVRASFGVAYEDVNAVPDERIDFYLKPIFDSAENTAMLGGVIMTPNSQNVSIESKLKQVKAPALIMWGDDDIFFDKKWAYWLKDKLPGARDVVIVPGGRLFWPEERPEYFAGEVRKFWASIGVRSAQGAGAAKA